MSREQMVGTTSSRQGMINELEKVANIAERMINLGIGKRQFPEIIEQMIDRLYPKIDLVEYFRKEDTAEIEEALGHDKPKYQLDIILKTLMDNPGVRAAKVDWDNGLNQEYIIYKEGVGYIKEYKTDKVNGDGRIFFKYVSHTYEPTKTDLEIDDWYLIDDIEEKAG